MGTAVQAYESTATPPMKALLGPHTLMDVHRGTGLSRAMITRVFSCKRRPSLDAASRIAGFLGVSIDKLYAAWAEGPP